MGTWRASNKILLGLLLSLMPVVAQAFECKKLFDFIKHIKPQSIDLLLEAMSKKREFKRFLGHYTLVYKSKSLQKATHLEPRAIVYGDDAKTIMTFINRADAHGRDVLELSCWNEPTASFEFFEIDFSNGLPPLDRLANKPKSCLECHGADPRPNFEAYNTWSGMFGSLSRLGCSSINKKSLEYQYYTEFLQKSRHSGRYKYLPESSEFKDHTTPGYGLNVSCTTYRYNTVLSDGDVPEPITEPAAIQFQNAFSKEPNAQLLDILTPLNFRRVARIISKNKNIEPFKYAMQGIKNSCDLKEGFFPESLVKAGPTLEELEYDTRQTVETEFAFREKHFLEFNQVDDDAPQIRLPINSALKSVVPVSQLRFIFERVGISFNRLTMGFDSGTYDFTTNMLATSTIISGIIELVYGPSPLVGENLLACERLAKLSMNALKDFTVQLSPKTSVEPKSLEALEAHEKLKAKEILDSKCLSCHSTNQIRIPFEDPEKIRNRVLGIHLKGRPQMPLGQPLDVEDQLLLIRYLQEVNSEKD